MAVQTRPVDTGILSPGQSADGPREGPDGLREERLLLSAGVWPFQQAYGVTCVRQKL